ncbi:MAG TPA: glycosyltransferase family A protein [Dongiaceae bacterium]|nr:glycosyltransferase family A protein [Dongiaceae bacterium]
MRISVIVPLYNTRAYIADAIDSILAQTRPPDDVVVVDDGSTDGSPDLVAGYAPRVRLFRQAHAGSATALNRGIVETTGETIAFLDADDLWERDKLKLQETVLHAEPETDCVFGLVQQFGQGKIRREPQRGVSRISMLIRRTAFERFGLFDTTLRVADFVPWYAHAVAMGLKMRMVERVVAHRRLHDTNSGITRRGEQQQESLLGLKQALDLRRRRSSPAPSEDGKARDRD